MNRVGSFFHIFQSDAFISQRNIALHVPSEKEHILLYLADGASKNIRIQILNVYPVNENFSLLNVKIPSDQI